MPRQCCKCHSTTDKLYHTFLLSDHEIAVCGDCHPITLIDLSMALASRLVTDTTETLCAACGKNAEDDYIPITISPASEWNETDDDIIICQDCYFIRMEKRCEASPVTGESHGLTSPGDTPPEYAVVRAILNDAFDRCATGKGHQQHGEPGVPFIDQHGAALARKYPDGIHYQIEKKLHEARRLDPPAARKELLDIIIFTTTKIANLDLQASRQ